MIIANLKGGLGNQMFQYALGRAFSLRLKDSEFMLDISNLDKASSVGDVYRPYTLSYFNIQESIANSEQVKEVQYPFGIFSKLQLFIKQKVFKQFNIGFNPKILDLKGSIYLDGFWQSEKYFIDAEKEIRNDFTLKMPLAGVAKENFEQINNEPNSVSLHFRRGDYVNNPQHDTDDAQYPQRAIVRLETIVSTPKYFVFSDDINWVKEHISLPEGTVFVSNPNMKDYEELILMSTCKHNIVANSTFSWWGAWLNNNPSKVVIAPKKWNNQYQNEYKDIIPETWITL